MIQYEAVIGLEVHAQMSTATKIFCGCSTTFGAEPNTQTCPVCEGLPGSLPVLNEKALEYSVRTGLALGSKITPLSRFARKNYFYPDLPKGYQISQYELPICEGGHVDITVEGAPRRIGLTRIHMEEDAGKNIHEERSPYSLVDLNRTGTPLMEIVSEPELRSAQEAAAYMKKLRAVLRYIGVCDGNMEQGSLRCDANISIRPVGETKLGTKVELKNINSFRFVERAIDYESKRQIAAMRSGEPIVQETRLWDTTANVTVSMRSKEMAHDYRYFPDPDLVPIKVEQKWVDELRATLPELPDAKRARYINDLALPEQDAEQLTEERATAEWFERCVELGGQPKAVANWMTGELTRMLNDASKGIEECPLSPERLVGMLKLIDDSTISLKIAKTVFEEMYATDKAAADIVKEKGLVQISDTDAIASAVDEVIAKSPKEFERLKAGDQKLTGFFVGQVMKMTKGKANPQAVNDILKKRLEA